MTASKVDIFNLALTNISAKAFVQSLTENSNERKYCSANYDAAVRAVLEDHDWNFASTYKTLAKTAATPQSPWTYQYTYPSGCLKAREIMRGSNDEDIVEYRVDLDSNGTGKVIHTDRAEAILRFTKEVLTPGLFSSLAIEAISWKLATRIAIPLTSNAQMVQYAEQQYQIALSKAQSSNFNEGQDKGQPTPEHIQVRS